MRTCALGLTKNNLTRLRLVNAHTQWRAYVYYLVEYLAP